MAERNLILTLHRKRKQMWVRNYSRIDTAVPRATQLLILEGEPGDVMELAHVNGKQLGTIKMKVNGHIVANWEWEKAL